MSTNSKCLWDQANLSSCSKEIWSNKDSDQSAAREHAKRCVAAILRMRLLPRHQTAITVCFEITLNSRNVMPLRLQLATSETEGIIPQRSFKPVPFNLIVKNKNFGVHIKHRSEKILVPFAFISFLPQWLCSALDCVLSPHRVSPMNCPLKLLNKLCFSILCEEITLP